MPYDALTFPRDTFRMARVIRNAPPRVRDVTSTPRRGGPAPFGWRWEGRALVADEHEQHVRWLVLLLHRRASSLSQIAAQLEQLGIPTREGGTTWPKTTLHRVISTAAALENTG